jgi:hypothetical protein
VFLRPWNVAHHLVLTTDPAGNNDGMRTVPLVGEKAWFGPRRFGWGLSPITIEGWIVTGVMLGLGFAAARKWPGNQVARAVPSVGLAAIALAKGTAPGGRQARSAFLASRSPSPAEASPGVIA